MKSFRTWTIDASKKAGLEVPKLPGSVTFAVLMATHKRTFIVKCEKDCCAEPDTPIEPRGSRRGEV